MSALPVQCAEPRCPRHAIPGSTRCRSHTRGWAGTGRGSGWARLRKQVLLEEPICRLGLAGCTITSTEVDHLLNRKRGGSDARANLAGCCSACHNVKTHHEAVIGQRLKRDQRLNLDRGQR